MTTKPTPHTFLPTGVAATRDGNVVRFWVTAAELEATVGSLLIDHHLPLETVVATDDRETDQAFHISYVFGVPGADFYLVPQLRVPSNQPRFPSLALKFQILAGYEREIHTFFGLIPDGHPDLRPLHLHENWPLGEHPLRRDFAWNHRPAIAHTPYDFRVVAGEGIYEIPVGPVHAGIIEPGHFRFSVAGEEIVALEPRLGYVHKGSEKLFEQLPFVDQVRLAERISGDSSFHHSLAFCQAVETLADTKVSEQSSYVRVIYAELERLTNHCGDLGGIMLDTGFSFGGSNGARLRERILQWIDRLVGSRFFRGVNVPGGVTRGIDPALAEELASDLEDFKRDFQEVMAIALDASSLMNRLKGTGVLDRAIAEDHGVVGVGARAVSIEHDARIDYPYAAYGQLPVKLAVETTGDVYARFSVRAKEVLNSLTLIHAAIDALVTARGPLVAELGSLKKDSFAVGLVEGWRGDIVYVVATDAKGAISRVKVRDASFVNWAIFPYVVLNDLVPDFPLINKSFSLSYSGNDL